MERPLVRAHDERGQRIAELTMLGEVEQASEALNPGNRAAPRCIDELWRVD